MSSWRIVVFLVTANWFLAGCGPPHGEISPHTIGLSAVEPVLLDYEVPKPKNLIEVPVSIFILDDSQLTFSSSRTADEVAQLHNGANQIWSQAGIRFTFRQVKRGTIPIAMTAHIVRWEVDDFFAAQAEMKKGFQPTTAVSGYFVNTVRGPNGITAPEHLAFFIADEPLNDDSRVVAHELGHILGLNHVDDPIRLMHSGSDGIKLTAEEIALARQTAENLRKK